MAKNKLVAPVVKWVGGKRQLIDEITPLLPKKIEFYCEPFLGGGAVLFSMQPPKAIVNDLNRDLMIVYEVIRDNVEELIESLKKHENTADYFYEIRDMDRDQSVYQSMSKVDRASRLLYLNKTCFNGLFRVNSSGEFNSPFGHYKNPNIVNEPVLRAVNKYLTKNDIILYSEDFEKILERVPNNGFVYLDPPYDPVSDTASFTGYNKGGFDKEEQKRLKRCCDLLDKRGVKFMLSNSATEFIKSLYGDYDVTIVKAKRIINSNVNGRGTVDEVLIRNYGKNDTAWEGLFEKYRILDKIEREGQYIITADEIRKFREPRLMTKFDHKINLPAIFQNNGLSILPITRGEYIISSFSAYESFEEPTQEVYRISIPHYLQSLVPRFLVSESIALNCANACGVMKDFLEDDYILPTVNGRMSSGQFDFDINTKHGLRTVNVCNSQIEIDAAYEGASYLSLFEAKHDLADDFIVRQLYYPFRVWNQRVTKEVKPIFLVFSNGVFNLYEYRFEEARNYNSLRLVKQKNYMISTSINAEDIGHLVQSVRLVDEPQIAFPQADRMSRIVNLIELLSERGMTRQEITSKYAFDERQTNYYTDAGRYLGLIEKGVNEDNEIYFFLSEQGRYIMTLDYRSRQLAIAKQILEHKVFNETLRIHLNCGEMPDRTTIMQIMKRSNLFNVKADSTYYRRTFTVIGWVNWILDTIDE